MAQRSSIEIFRDCLRLINHVGGKSDKALEIRKHVMTEFKRNKNETDPAKITIMKDCAVQGLTNYLLTYNMSKLKQPKDSMHRRAPIQDDNLVEEKPKPRPRPDQEGRLPDSE